MTIINKDRTGHWGQGRTAVLLGNFAGIAQGARSSAGGKEIPIVDLQHLMRPLSPKTG